MTYKKRISAPRGAYVRRVRPVRIEGDTIYVPLTRGYEALVSIEDYNLVAPYNWHVGGFKEGEPPYALRYVPVESPLLLPAMHNAIGKPRAGLVIDHIDGNTLNNRRDNLREATSVENARNKPRLHLNREGKSSRFVGVYWEPGRQKWKAIIGVDHRDVCLGRFESELEAAEVRRLAVIRIFGAFGSLAK